MTGFRVPPYPYDRLGDLAATAASLEGGAVDLSIGTPCDPPPGFVVEALARSGAERGYPPSIGAPAYREAAAGWMARRLGVTVDPAGLAACVGTKELVASVPQHLRLRSPERDTVLHPELAYPSYAMGALLAGCRPVAYRSLEEIDPADAARALCVWVNSPANPHGDLHDLGEAAAWGRGRGVPVLSDECYVEFTWAGGGAGRTILEHGPDGVLAVHSLSKRSNLAGVRAGFYAGDADLVRFLGEVRKHAGLMVPGPVQAAAVAAWGDDVHVDAQRDVYRRRLGRLAAAVEALGAEVALPAGGFYLWVPSPPNADGDADGWAFAARLAGELGVVATPGDTFGPAGAGHVRLAAVQPDDRIDLVCRRAGVAVTDDHAKG